jgi:hypothetical protein
MNISESVLLGNRDALQALLLYHASPKFIPLDDMKPGTKVPVVLFNKTLDVTT